VSAAGYWRRYRTGRRGFLAAAGGIGLGSLSLALLGCRGSSDVTASPPHPELAPENTTGQARPGGTLKTAIAFDASNFDPLASNSTLTHTQIAAYTYPRLLKFAAAVYPESANGNVEGDLAEAFEMTPDHLTLTLRLRPGLRWESRPPTNARVIDAQDVLFSWNKFARFSPFRADLVYHALESPGSPVDSVTSPDPRTVVFKLKQADAAVAGLLASERLLYVMPRESDGGFDPRFDVRGYGPWLMAENRTGQQRIWSRNPDYYVKGRPFIERIEATIMGEYGARLAHFKAGAIYNSMVSQDDLLATRGEIPELLLRKSDTYAVAPSTVGFGYNELPWRDERLRQAVSHLVDRETLIDLRTNRRQFAAVGLELSVRYHTAIGAGWEGIRWTRTSSAPTHATSASTRPRQSA
jgi:ABC-type transport system substrate-binding protein